MSLASRCVGQHAAHLPLQVLGAALPDRQPVAVAQERRDRLVEVVAADPDRPRGHDRPQRQDGHLAGAAPDVDDRVGLRLVDLQPGADRGGQRLLDQVGGAGPGGQARLGERALLDVGDPRRGAHDHPRMREAPALDLAEEVAQHLLGHLEVGDHPVAQGPDRRDRGRGAPDHPLGLVAHRVHAAGGGVDGDDRGLGGDDALVAHVDERVRGAEVDRDVAPAGSEQSRALGLFDLGCHATHGSLASRRP